jgi:hypothetical protein
LYSRLSGYSGLSALVGSRIYPPLASQEPTPPYVTYYEISHGSDHAMGGRTGLYLVHYAVEAWAETQAEALAIARQIENALDGYSGTSDTIVITYAMLRPSGGPPYDEESGLYRRLREFDIEFRL